MGFEVEVVEVKVTWGWKMGNVTYRIEKRAILDHDVALFGFLRRILKLYINERPTAPWETHIELALVDDLALKKG